jgi:hypothetical protein
MRISNDKIARLLLPVGVGAACSYMLLTAMSGYATLTNAKPHVGDIVSFAASRDEPAEGGTRLIVHRPGQYDCVLDLNTLRHSGGSLMIEGELTDEAGHYRAHWAGERTTTDSSNCGQSTDLILDAGDLDTIAASAGGYGASKKRLPVAIKEVGK